MTVGKRLLDLTIVVGSLPFLALPLAMVAVLVKLTSNGPVLYWSDRVGIDNKEFSMPKFRTMRLGTPAVATHLLENAESYLTPIGGFLRKYSVDELPQLLSVLKGELSLVGPRPALFNQHDLVRLRTEKGIHRLLPGLTGWAQINGRDALTLEEKVTLEDYYLKHLSLGFDLIILVRTVFTVLSRQGVWH